MKVGLSEKTTKPEPTREPDVRPQKPRRAPNRSVWKKPPDVWDRNPHGVGLVVLLLNLALFIYACLLFSRLTTGYYVPPEEMTTFSFSSQPLGEFMLGPISIWQSPQTAVLITAFLALFITAIIVVSQFYGPGWSLLFIVMLALIAHMPLLAVAMLGAAGLANARWLGIGNRFVKGLIALIFPIAALWISTSATESFKSPMERIYLHFPWVAAITSSMLLMMLFWLTARLCRYRAGVATLMIGLLVAGAWGLLNFGIGLDQLEFRLLEKEFGLTSQQHFHSRSIKTELDARVDQLLARAEIQNATEEFRDKARADARFELRLSAGAEMNESRERVMDAYQRFLQAFPNSRYRPYVMFLMARAADMKLDLSCIKRKQAICYYEDQPSPEGREIWMKLWTNYRKHPLSIVARFRLAQVHLAEAHLETSDDMVRNRINFAQRLLREAWDDYRVWQAEREQSERESSGHYLLSIFNLQSADTVTTHLVQERIESAPRWQWLIENNRGDGPSGDLPLSEYFAINPHQDPSLYEQKLRDLQRKYQDSRMVDNLDLMIRMSLADPQQRIKALRAFITSYAGSPKADAQYAAMAELAQQLVKGSPADREEARQHYRRLRSAGEPFASEARRALHAMGEEPEDEPPAIEPAPAALPPAATQP